MNIAIMGYGTVGVGVDHILKDREDIHVTRILERKERIDSDSRKTSSFEDILNDDSIQGVVETLGGIDIPFEYISKLLNKGKFVVSANKAVVAAHFKEFHDLSKKNNVPFLYEASVGGVLPILHTIKSMREIEPIEAVGGILNGTSNYILDKMTQDKISFAEALKQAQNLGYAERDPSADISGFDVKNKIMIASSLAFKTIVDFDAIHVFGIENISSADILAFHNQGVVCKLFASAKKDGNSYTINVEPTLFLEKDIVASVHVNNNIAFVTSKSSGTIMIHGQGAGRYPTGYAIVSDLIDIKENRVKETEFSNVMHASATSKDESYYVRTIATSAKKYTALGNNSYLISNITKANFIDLWNEILKEDKNAFYARYDEEVIKERGMENEEYA